jgi:signal transduction histidine kinase
MIEHFRHLAAVSFIPHGHCYLWDPAMLFTQVSANLLIGLSYIAIAITMTFLIFRIKNLPFQHIYIAFGIFIISCGITHFMEIWTTWFPDYWLDAFFRGVTALASVGTAIVLPSLVPKAVAFANAARAARDHGIKLETAYEELGQVFNQAKELNKLRSDFFANISHELRTPLSLILGPTETLLKSQVRSPEELQNLEVIRRNARLLLKHVNDLLDVSKLEARKLQPRIYHSDLAAHLRMLASHFVIMAQDHAIQLEVDAATEVFADYDSNMIERVILNLVSNAFKFVPDGGIIRLRAFEKLHDGLPFVGIEVADSGPGVAAKYRRIIFERFSQLSGEGVRTNSGSGLGLSIAKEFVYLHQGVIEVSEAPEGGALFRVLIPKKSDRTTSRETEHISIQMAPLLQTIDEIRNFNRAAEVGGANSESEKPTIVLVEDNLDLNRFITRTLSPQYEVCSTFNGSEAFDKICKMKPDLILCDVMMPQMNGDVLAEKIRKNVDLNNIPIIILTAKIEDEFRIRLLKNGVQDYLAKPFSTEELVVRVSNQIAMKRTRDLLQKELQSQMGDLESLALEVTHQRRELQDALEKMIIARDEASRASQAKDNFLGLVSHEVRTPLTALHMQLEMFQRSFTVELDDKQKNMMSRIFKSSARSLEIIDTLLEYTRLQSGRISITLENFDLEPVVKETMSLFAAQAEEKGLLMTFAKAVESSPIKSDMSLIKTVLQNLIGNAVKYTDQGDVKIILTKNEDHHVIIVTDSGPGIDSAVHEKIFDPFEQAEPLERKHKVGFGLGLSIARQAATAVGGVIRVNSSLGHGSEFRLELPLTSV